MKTLIKNRSAVVAIFLLIFTIFFGQNSVYGINVADRTAQVRDAIVVAAGVGTPEEVTEDHLAAITALSLGLSNIVSLQAGDFEGLTALQMLLLNNNDLTDLPETVFSDLVSLRTLLLNNNQLTALPETVFSGLPSLQVLFLNNNQLTDLPERVFSDLVSLQALRLNDNQLTILPAGVFRGLTALQYLYLDNNAVDPVDLMVSLEQVADGQFKAAVPTGAPFDIVLPVNMTNGSIIGGATSLTIPQGSVESEVFTVTRTPGTLAAVTADIGTLPDLPVDHNGYGLVKSGDLPLVLIGSEGIHPLSDRTPQVRDAIVAAAGVGTPEEVTEDHLAAITALNLSFSDITSLKATDFDGLISLEVLLLNNNHLTDLPVGVFSGLISLQSLYLNNNLLTFLSETVFNSLISLEVLLLNNNQLADLSVGVFSGLISLQSLYLDSNQLTVLPEGVFSGLTALEYLYLNNNAVAPIDLTVSLERVGEGQFKAVVPTGAPFEIRLPLNVTNGSIIGGATSLTIPQGSVESDTFTVIRTPGTITPVTTDIGVLPGLPEAHRGYGLVKSGDLPIVLIRSVGINPLSARTPQVRDAIVIAAGVNAPEDVTEDHLSAITSLNLAFSNITSLKAGDFDDLTSLEVLLLNDNQLTFLPETVFSGLTSLQQLNLSTNQLAALPETVFSGLTSLQHLDLFTNQLTFLPAGVFRGLTSLQYLDLFTNQLTFLPAGVFRGLTSLQQLYLDNNAVDPIDLTVSLERVGEGQFKAVVPTGAPFDITLPFRITNGRVSSGETTLTIPQGSMESEVLTVDHTFERLMLVTVAIETLPDLPFGHSGYALVQPSDLPVVLLRSDGIHPLSARTLQVRDAIVAAAGVNAPEEVTEDHLAAITSLSLGLSNITSLKAGDFEGLISLQVLLLNNNQLTDLPVAVFEGLTSLQVLLLNNNQLTFLPVGVFSDLPLLQQLDLSTNALTTLPVGIFDGLTALQSLNVDNNAVVPIALMVSLEPVGEGQFKAVVPTGTPFEIRLPIRITNGSTDSGETSLLIPQGGMESEMLTVARTPGTIAAVTADIGTLPDLPIGHSGYAVVKSSELPIVLIGSEGIHPLSDRTPQVRDAIVVAAGVNAPEEVTEDHLAAITALNLNLRNITSLNDRDFEGLTALQVLFLNNNHLTACRRPSSTTCLHCNISIWITTISPFYRSVSSTV